MKLTGDLQDMLKDSCDMTEHSIILQEWYFNTGEYRFYNDKTERPTSILVNGQGRSLGQETAGSNWIEDKCEGTLWAVWEIEMCIFWHCKKIKSKINHPFYHSFFYP